MGYINSNFNKFKEILFNTWNKNSQIFLQLKTVKKYWKTLKGL